MYKHIYIDLHIHTCMQMWVFLYTSTFVYTYTYIYIYMYVYICIYACMYVRMYVCMYVHMYICTWVVCMYVCMYAFVYVCIWTKSITMTCIVTCDESAGPSSRSHQAARIRKQFFPINQFQQWGLLNLPIFFSSWWSASYTMLHIRCRALESASPIGELRIWFFMKTY